MEMGSRTRSPRVQRKDQTKTDQKMETGSRTRSPRIQRKEQTKLNADVLEEYDIIFDKHDKMSPSCSTKDLNSDVDSDVNSSFKSTNPTPTTETAAHIDTGLPSTDNPQCLCPPVNCPEKIIICLDLNEEMQTTMFSSRAGDRFSSLELARKSIRMFVMHKSQMNPSHEFALITFDKEATMIHPPTRNSKKLLNILDSSNIITESSEPLDLSSVFETIKDNVDLPVVNGNAPVNPPSYIVRLVMIYGRSNSIPVRGQSEVQRELESSPYFFTDVLYIHKPLSQDNQCEDIFSFLCSLDHCGLSYIFEVSKYTPMLNCGAKLLAHPLQRPTQAEAKYKISAGPKPHAEEQVH